MSGICAFACGPRQSPAYPCTMRIIVAAFTSTDFSQFFTVNRLDAAIAELLRLIIVDAALIGMACVAHEAFAARLLVHLTIDALMSAARSHPCNLDAADRATPIVC